LSDKEAERNELILQEPVRRIMQREVLTVQPGDSLIQAGKVLWESKIGCLPVVDGEGTLVGMLTKSDFIRVALQLMGSDVKRDDLENLERATSQASGIARAG
jgi:acetoin utilization protein AcuB